MILFLNLADPCDIAITEIASGNKKALERVYNEYGRMILSVAYQITGDFGEAEDVLQDTMIRILRLSHTYKKGTNPKAWVLKVTRNSAVDNTSPRPESLHTTLTERQYFAGIQVSGSMILW
jgi:RNA polymerase sigma-70 factor (ECF subfamily)